MPDLMECAWCGDRYAANPRGRPRRFCSEQCRKARHHRERVLRSQVARYDRLAAVNAEPYSSHFEAKAAAARAQLAELSKIAGVGDPVHVPSARPRGPLVT